MEGHLEKREGDTYFDGRFWYPDYEWYLDARAEYRRPEYREDD